MVTKRASNVRFSMFLFPFVFGDLYSDEYSILVGTRFLRTYSFVEVS